MIKEKRLRELVQNNQIVYYLKNKNIQEIKLNPQETTFYRDYMKIKINNYNKNIYFSKLFETKEDAEFYKDFGNIKRTERLDLPNWEELNNILQIEKDFKLEFTKNKFEDVILYIDKNKISIMIGTKDYMSGFDKDFNKENYLLSCKEIKKLFLGDKNK